MTKQDQLEGEIRGIKRLYTELSTPHSNFYLIESETPIVGIRLGGIGVFTYPDEVILDKVYVLAQRVWQFKDYLKSVTGLKQRQDNPIEHFASTVEELLICADLGNSKKHCGVDQPRTRLAPQLGVFSNVAHLGVVEFDTSRNGMIQINYDGRTRSLKLGVSKPVPIPFRVDFLVSNGETLSSMGNAVEFIYAAFRRWEPLMSRLKVAPRPDFV